MEVYPVVHINDPETAKEQAELALDFGADGVYLIDHHGRTQPIFDTMRKIRAERPNSFIGVNFLGHTIDDVYEMIDRSSKDGGPNILPNAVWADDVQDNFVEPESFLKQKKRSPTLTEIKLLGGISFKYTPTFTEDPKRASAETTRLRDAVDVVTTSGAGTGKAPTVEKLRAVKQAAGDKPVAVASGISTKNIKNFDGLVDQILVSSSVETRPYSGIFDEEKLKEIIQAAHDLD
jgi:predicted TIM-barrel enzyme